MVKENDDGEVMLDTGVLEDRLAGGTLTPIASNIAWVEIDHKSLLLLILEKFQIWKDKLGNLRHGSCLRQKHVPSTFGASSSHAMST